MTTEVGIVRVGERSDLADHHPELARLRPDLAQQVFADNPVPCDEDFPVLFYCLQDGQIAGSRKAIPDLLYHDDGAGDAGHGGHPFTWCFDAHVHPAHHGKGIGTAIVSRMAHEFEKRGTIVASAYSVPAMIHIYRKLSYKVLGVARRFALLRDAAPILKSRLGNTALANIAAVPVNAALAGRRMAKGTRRFSGLEMRAIDPADWHRLWPQIPEPPATYRWDRCAQWSAARLQPRDTCYAIKKGGEDIAMALFVLRDRAPSPDDGANFASRISMMHYKYDGTPDGASALVRALASLLHRRRASVADCVTSDPALQSQFTQLGFSRREEGMTFAFKAPAGVTLPGSGQQSDWKLTPFCSDGFLFP